MNRLVVSIIFIILAPISVVNAAESLNSEMTKCAALDRDLQRLNCYDRLAGKVSSFAEEAVSERVVKDTIEHREITTATAKPESSFGLNNSVPATDQSFGLSSNSDSLDEMHSTIPGEFTGWNKGDIIKLANGQKWKISNSSRRLYHKATNPKVIITRASFGSYMLEIEGINNKARVKRIK